MNRLLFALVVCLLVPLAEAAEKSALLPPTEKRVYKEIGDTKLELWIWKPADWKPTDRRTAIVFYHGGGWRGGSPNAFSRQSEKLAARGMVAISVQYRLTAQPGVQVEDCVKDARSAFRYVRAHAAELGINPEKIAAGGGSAGGHLAATLVTLDSVNDPKDDTSIRPQPVALVLFNPALKLGGLRAEPTAGFRNAAAVAAIDPFEHVKRGHPPTIIFHGEDDTTVPIATARAYAAKVESLGGSCQVVGFQGQVHAFFNKEPFVWDTLKLAETFLEQQGLLAASTASATQSGGAAASSPAHAPKFAKAKLLGVRRISPKPGDDSARTPRDGLTFAILVSPTTDSAEQRSLKETKDVLVGGESYQDKTHAALGRRFQPHTTVHDADKFFAETPALANGEVAPTRGSFVLTMTFPGAELPAGAPVELTLHAGYLKQPDTFTLRARIPPTKP